MALNKMKQYGVKETTDSYIINYLNEKWIAIRTIVKAKKRMESLLINLD
jgi:hypothetical protein